MLCTRRTWLIGSAAVLASARARAAEPRARACIVLYMHGGASQLETFDPKPGRPTGGPTRAIATEIDGVRFAEHLPRLAARADRLALLRSVTAREGNHDRARYLMRTGHVPQGGVSHPGLGALISELRGGDDPLPAAVAIGAPTQGPGMLGARHAPLTIRNPSEPLRNLVPAGSLAEARRHDRAALVSALDRGFAHDRAAALVRTNAELRARAARLAEPDALAAFDLARESSRTRERYGAGRFADGCLLARRLVGAGFGFVEVGLQGWDTHEDGFTRTAALCGELDRAMAALLDDLAADGTLSQTLVVWLGDFGRTPEINARDGRDHHPRTSSVVLAGAGIPGGTVIGATDRDGREIRERPIEIADLFRTIDRRLGIDPDQTRLAASGRPITTVDGGTEIAELVR